MTTPAIIMRAVDAWVSAAVPIGASLVEAEIIARVRRLDAGTLAPESWADRMALRELRRGEDR